MGRSKIVDHGEVLRWFQEGRTYQWMVDEYLRKYNIETTLSMWGNYRRTRGLDRRITRDDELIPWEVQKKHRWAYPVSMLRAEARRRSGQELTPAMADRLDSWLAQMHDGNMVVHYDPDTEDGFFYVEPRPGVDTDLIRRPEQKTTKRRAAD